MLAGQLHNVMGRMKNGAHVQAIASQIGMTARMLTVLANDQVITHVRDHGNLKFGLPKGRIGNNNPEYRRNRMVHACAGVDGVELQAVAAVDDFSTAKLAHSAGFVFFLESAFQRWEMELQEDRSYVLPNSDPAAEVALVPFHCTKSDEPRSQGLSAEFACYASDFETPIFESTSSVLKDDLGIVGSAVDRIVQGDQSVYALTTHAGHHAGPAYFSGFCYLNNASIACSLLEKAGRIPALLDLDFHAGNGSFDIAEANGRWFRSINCAGAYPWVDMGISGIELPPGTGWSDGYAIALEKVLGELPEKVDTIVVSLGFDTLASDPEAGKRAGVGLSLQTEDFQHMASALASRGLPVLVVQEGGYDLDSIPIAVSEFVKGFP